MTTLSKILIAAAALLLLPLSAYAVGAMTAPTDAPVPRRDIEVVDEQSTSTPDAPRNTPRGQEPRGADDDDDDDQVRIVKPKPSRVPANVDDDDRRGGNGRGDDSGDDDGDDDDSGDDSRDDDDDDSGDDDGDD